MTFQTKPMPELPTLTAHIRHRAALEAEETVIETATTGLSLFHQ